MKIVPEKLCAKCCKATWNGSVLTTSSIQYESFKSSDLYRVFKTVQVTSLRKCAVFLVGRWIGSRTENVQRKGHFQCLLFSVTSMQFDISPLSVKILILKLWLLRISRFRWCRMWEMHFLFHSYFQENQSFHLR